MLAAHAARSLFAVSDAVAYLNSASLGPRMHAVNDAGDAAVDEMAAPWNIRSADWFEGCSPSACPVCITDRSIGGMCCAGAFRELRDRMAARNVRVERGDNIVVVDQEYRPTTTAGSTWRSSAAPKYGQRSREA